MNSLRDPLIQEESKQDSCWDKLFRNKKIAPSNRIVAVKQPSNIFTPNKVCNTKYSIMTFIPLVLYNQFKYFLNLFFLIMCLSQFIPPLKVGYLFTYIAPLTLVIFISMVKQAYDDIKRFLNDKQFNSKVFRVFTPHGFIQKKSSELKVGNIVEVCSGQKIPADLLMLWTQTAQESVFIKTDQLDGQTDWKLRYSLKTTSKLININPQRIFDQEIIFEINPPSGNIYKFEGVLKMANYSQAINLENTLWMSTILASSKLLGIVVYTGKQTRIVLNSKQYSTKMGRIDLAINNFSIFLFIFLSCISVVLVIFSQGMIWWQFIKQISRFIILLSTIIPLCMRVNLDFAKIVYSFWINQDKQIHTSVRNSNIPEQLGCINYFLTDKTGTLTKNQMKFKKVSLISVEYRYQDKQAIQNIIQKYYSQNKQTINNTQKQLTNFVIAISVCHNVNIIEEPPYFQASSPDELALVQTAAEFGIKLTEKSTFSCSIQTPGKIINFTILQNFPFSSERKRMGILLREKQSGRIIYYLKGADIVIIPKLMQNIKVWVEQECEILASQGLRTLIITKKEISQDFYLNWNIHLKQARQKLIDRELEIENVVNQLEKEMEFLGISGVEDFLQDDVNKSLQSLRNAGIKIWMLTGDKVQTATCICISSGLKPSNYKIYYIINIQKKQQLLQKFIQFNSMINSSVLLIDGNSLSLALQFPQVFVNYTKNSQAVICCRVSPLQKSQVVNILKKYTKDICLAIGDGGNDVAMIKTANVGIGIIGKEGNQASLSSDYSIENFKDVVKLLIYHGRLSFHRTSLLSQFIIHRGLMISIIQVLFSCIFYYVSIPVFNGILTVGYTTVFTMIPVFCLILDQDVNVETALKFPNLYASLRKGRQISKVSFFSWILKATYQGSVILIVIVIIYWREDLKMLSTLCFTTLILTQYFMVLSQINRFNYIIILSTMLSLGIYILCITVLRMYVDVMAINIQNISMILLVFALSWGPIFITKLINLKFFPTDYQKAMKFVNRERFGYKTLHKQKQQNSQ